MPKLRESTMESKTNLPMLDGASTRSSGMEPEPCYCQSQGRYAGECVSWGECTQQVQDRDPEDTYPTWIGPEPPHLYSHALDDVRSLISVRDPAGPDPACVTPEEKNFCVRYCGRCAFSNEGGPQGFGDMWLEAHKPTPDSSAGLSIDEVIAMKRACARCGDDIERIPPIKTNRPPDPPMYRHIGDQRYATFSGQVAGPRCERPSMDACVDCGGETCAPGCPTRLPDDA